MEIPDCMTAEEIRMAMLDNKHIGILSKLVLCGLPSTKAEVQKDPKPYCSFRDATVINR